MALPSPEFLPAALARNTVEALHAELGPPRPWVHGTILALALAALLALPLVHVDVTIRAAGLVRAAAERTDLRTAVAGRIARLWLRDNSAVAAGQPVLELASASLDERLAHNRARQQLTRDLIHDLSLLSAAAGGVAVHHHTKTSPAAAESPARGAPRFAPAALRFAPGAPPSALRFDLPSTIYNLLSAPACSLHARASAPSLSPAAVTGAVAAEASETPAAGDSFRFQIVDWRFPIPASAFRPWVRAPSERIRPPSARQRSTLHSPPSTLFPSAFRPWLRAPSERTRTDNLQPGTDNPAAPPPAPCASRFALSASLRTPALAAELAELEARLAAQAVAAERARTELQRVTVLHDRGIAPRRELDDARFAFAHAQAEAELLRQQSLARWRSRLRGEQLALMALVSEEAHLGDERSFFTIRSPIAGTLLGLTGLAEGTWVAAGQVVASVSPADRLIVEAAVPAHRIGFLREGQPVKLAVDTYAPTEWGTLDATARSISADLQAAAPGVPPHYRVLIAPHRTALTRPDGARAPLRKGMTVSARFQVARRSLLQLLYEDTSQWLDPTRSPNN